MRFALACSLLLAWFTGSVCAQTSGPGHRLVLRGDSSALDCPVGFSVHHAGLTATLREAGNKPGNQYAQTLQLQFDRTRTGRIARIALVVHGTAGKAEALLLANERPAETAQQALELGQSMGRFDPVQYVVTDSVPVITRVEITAVDYQDGTSWRAPSANACSVAPSPFVLVNASVQ